MLDECFGSLSRLIRCTWPDKSYSDARLKVSLEMTERAPWAVLRTRRTCSLPQLLITSTANVCESSGKLRSPKSV